MYGKSPIIDKFIATLQNQINKCEDPRRAAFYNEMLEIRRCNPVDSSKRETCLQEFDRVIFPSWADDGSQEETSELYDQLNFFYWEFLVHIVGSELDCHDLIPVQLLWNEFVELGKEILLAPNSKELELSGTIESMFSFLQKNVELLEEDKKALQDKVYK